MSGSSRVLRLRPKSKPKPKKKPEMMKLIVCFVTLNAVGWIWCSYVLAFLGRVEIAQQLSITALTSLVAVVLTYALKSLGEKHSLNKHGLRIPDPNSPDANKGKHYLAKPESESGPDPTNEAEG